jgi:hypothetical protein
MNDITGNKAFQNAMNAQSGPTQVLWPTWVLDGIAQRIYQAKFPKTKPRDFEVLDEVKKTPYRDMARGALQWIEEQGWVKMPKQGE